MDGKAILKKVNYLLWIGNEAIHIWDRTAGTRQRLDFEENRYGFTHTGEVPHMPRFTCIWENPSYYQKTLCGLLGKNTLLRRHIIIAIPEDLNEIEKKALTDMIVYAQKGYWGKPAPILCYQSILLHFAAQNYIAITQSCRCYNICLIQNGGLSDVLWLDSRTNTPDDFAAAISALQEKFSGERLEVYYPQAEEDFLPAGIGTAVSFDTIGIRCLTP